MAIIKVDNIHIAGIPCSVEVEAWQAEPMTRWEPGEPAGWELYRVFDRKGYEAKWLENKLEDPKVQESFEEVVDKWLDDHAQDDAEEYADYLYEQQKERSWGL
jgi:hypothetical protein